MEIRASSCIIEFQSRLKTGGHLKTNAVCLDIKSSRHGHICHLGTFDTALTSLNSLVGVLLQIVLEKPLCFGQH